MLKLNKLLTSNTADSVDENVMRYVFYEDCKVCDEDDEDSEDNKDMNCEESS